MNKILVVLGAQFGDEGKGKFSDFLSSHFDYVVRYQGGDNAGHTVLFNENKYKLSLIPSGIFCSKAVIAHGVVLNPFKLLEEIEYLKQNEVTIENRLFVSDHCHVILDYHISMDGVLEKFRGAAKIGTTNKGIGPCYTDKVSRFGIRVVDLFDYEILSAKIKLNLSVKNIIFKTMGEKEYVVKEVADKYFEVGKKIKPYICNTIKLLNNAYEKRQKILLEGAQGVLLDIDYGTYPFVTSSNVIGALSAGTGLAFQKFKNILGLVKAYSSRVGAGPFVTEIEDQKLNEYIRVTGKEYGTTTGRMRRIGWLDLVSLKYSVQISGINYIALTLIDVLTNIPAIKVCVDYELNQKSVSQLKSSINNNQHLKPVYKTFAGWNQDISAVRSYKDLPKELHEYVNFIEAFLNVKVAYVSVGPNREQTIIKEAIHD